MSLLLAANNAGTTLASALNPTATTIALATGTGVLFPQPTTGQYYVATLIPATSTTGLPNEIVWVTGMTGDTATVVRGRESTTPLSFNIGDSFQNLWTAGSFDIMLQISEAQAQPYNYAVDSGTANSVVVALSPVVTSLSGLIGTPIRIQKGANSNTGATTLTVNGLGPIAIVPPGGGSLWAGALAANSGFEVWYDGVNFDLVSPPAVLKPGSATNTVLATMGPNTFKANVTGSTAAPADVSLAAALTNSMLATMAGDTVKANITGGSASPTDVGFTSLLGAMGQTAGITGPTSMHFYVSTSIGVFLVNVVQWVWSPSGTNPYANFNWDVPFPTACIGAWGNVGYAENGTSSPSSGHAPLVNVRPDTNGGAFFETVSSATAFSGTHTVMLIGVGY